MMCAQQHQHLYNGSLPYEIGPDITIDDVVIEDKIENLESHAGNCLELTNACRWQSKYDLSKWQWLLATSDQLTVAVCGGRWVGLILRKDFTSVAFIGPQVFSYVGMLVVHPDFQGKHVAQNLVIHHKNKTQSLVGAVTTAMGLQPYLAIGVTPVEPFLNSSRRVSAACSIVSKLPTTDVCIGFAKPTQGDEVLEFIALDANVTGLDRASLLMAATFRPDAFSVVARKNCRIVGGLMGWTDPQSNTVVLGPIIGTDEVCLALVRTIGLEHPDKDKQIAFVVKARPHVLQTLRSTGFTLDGRAEHGEVFIGEGMPHRNNQWYFAPLNFFHG